MADIGINIREMKQAWAREHLNAPYFVMIVAMMLGLLNLITQLVPSFDIKVGPLLSFTLIGLLAYVLLIMAQIIFRFRRLGEIEFHFSTVIYVLLIAGAVVGLMLILPDMLKDMYAIDNLRQTIMGVF